MNLVVDSSVLVAEVLRLKGLALLSHPDLTLFQPDYAAGKTEYELRRREKLIVRSGRASEVQAAALLESAFAFPSAGVIQVAAREYASRANEHQSVNR